MRKPWETESVFLEHVLGRQQYGDRPFITKETDLMRKMVKDGLITLTPMKVKTGWFKKEIKTFINITDAGINYMGNN